VSERRTESTWRGLFLVAWLLGTASAAVGVLGTLAVQRMVIPIAAPSGEAEAPTAIVAEPDVIHKMDRRLDDSAAFWRCTNQRHDYAENMAYQWKDVTCPECLELRARGPDVPPIEAQANGGK